MEHLPDSTEELARAAAVGDFVEMWTADRRAGTCRSLGEYLVHFPGFEAAIAREYLCLAEPAEAPVDAEQGVGDFGPYRTIRLLGEGGQGAVWLAEDTRLRRQVALKVLSGSAAPVLRGRVERLRREAQALAKLAHPGICAIHEAQLDGPRPFLAMQLVEGENLAAVLLRREPLAERRVLDRGELQTWLDFFQKAAAALHAAHTLGIVHRDIKPGNLMRTPSGNPVLLDFGFARDLEVGTVSLTQSGELFGTVPYMAPEVLVGRVSDHRVDVYALAVTMYEVLVGHRPFVGATQAVLRQAIESGDARRLDDLSPVLGADLALVVATAMERDPERRYSTAAALAEDLRRVQAREPIAASPLGGWIRLSRVLKRHPAIATGLGLLLVGFLVAIVLLAKLSRERTRLLALRQAHLAQQMAAETPGSALFVATEAARVERHPEINDVIYEVLDLCWEEHAVFRPQVDVGESEWFAITEDDRHLVRGTGRGEIRIVDLARGSIVRTIVTGTAGWTNVTLAAGDAILAGCADGVVRRFDFATGAQVGAWRLHEPALVDKAAISQLVVAPDRRHFASCGSDGRVAVAELDSAEPVRCMGHTGGVAMAAFDPAGRRLATMGGNFNKVPRGDKAVRIFAADTGQLLQTFGPFPEFMHWVSWSHDGTRLAIAHEQAGVQVFDVATGRLVTTVAEGQSVHWVGFGPGDACLALGSSVGFSVYELGTGKLVVHYADFQDRSVFRGAFSGAGDRLAVVAWDDTARVYETSSWRQEQVFRGVLTRALGLGWNRRGSRVYTVGGCLQSWYAEPRPFLPVAKGLPGRLVSARFSPAGDRILAANATGEVRIWEAEHGTDVATLQTGMSLRDVQYSGLRDRLLLIGDKQPARLSGGGQPDTPLEGGAATAGWVLDDGRIVLTGADGAVRVHDASTGAMLHEVKCHDRAIEASALHPTRHWLATGGDDRSFCLVDLDNGQRLHRQEPWSPGTIGDHESVFAFAFTSAADHLFVSCEDGKVRDVDLTHEFTVHEWGVGPTPGRLMLSPDGGSLFVGAQWSGKLRRYDLANPSLVTAHAAPHANLLVALARQPHGPLALSASKDGVVSIFDADRDELVSVIHATKSVLATACFSPEGARILTAEVGGLVRVWPVDPLPVALRVRPSRLDGHIGR